MNSAYKMSPLSSLNESRAWKWSRLEYELIEMMRDSKLIENAHFDAFCKEVKMTLCVCLSLYVCAWERHWSKWFYDSESHASSIWAANFKAFVFTTTEKCDEIIAQRFLGKTSLVGPGRAIWALQGVWIWWPGRGRQVCLGWRLL